LKINIAIISDYNYHITYHFHELHFNFSTSGTEANSNLLLLRRKMMATPTALLQFPGGKETVRFTALFIL